jgi:hypothetical protein
MFTISRRRWTTSQAIALSAGPAPISKSHSLPVHRTARIEKLHGPVRRFLPD